MDPSQPANAMPSHGTGDAVPVRSFRGHARLWRYARVMPAADRTLTPQQLGRARAAVRRWFAERGRSISFRETSDAWPVLVSEVMLQQTQVARVVPAWNRFMAAFPTPRDLTRAPMADVLRAWAGLGYNRRAMNLRRTAALLCERHGGEVPRDPGVLRTLPGVGPYTARAVAAICFAQPEAAVDTNVRRVLGRFRFGHGGGHDSGPAPRAAQLQTAADEFLDASDPRAWTYAVMDIGSLVCRPARPECSSCPLRPWCQYAGRAEVEVDAQTLAAIGKPHDRVARAPVTRVPVARAPVVRTPFEASNRWLRGHIVERLRNAPGDAWLSLSGPIGAHSVERVALALSSLEADGMLERREDGCARLPVGRP